MEPMFIATTSEYLLRNLVVSNQKNFPQIRVQVMKLADWLTPKETT